MLSPFYEYFITATRVRPLNFRDMPARPRPDRGRWRAHPKWREMPEHF